MSTYILKDNVFGNLLRVKKFNNITFRMDFTSNMNKRDFLLKLLLSEIINKKLKEREIQIYLSNLYGAKVVTNTSVYGNLAVYSIRYSSIKDERTLISVIEIAQAYLLNPELISTDDFNISKSQLFDQIASMKQNFSLYAQNRLNYMIDPKIDIYQYTSEYLNKVTYSEFLNYYKKMTSIDRLDFTLVGNVDESRFLTICDSLNYDDRENSVEISDMKFLFDSSSSLEEPVPDFNSYLLLGLHTGIVMNDREYAPLLVYNAILGAFPHSRIPMAIKRNRGLAYYAVTSIDIFRGMIILQTNIERNSKETVLRMINNELSEIKRGNFTDEELQKNKMAVINQQILIQETPDSMAEYFFSNIH